MSTRFYDTDLTDAAWAWVAPVLPAARPGGRPRTTNLRAILNAPASICSSASSLTTTLTDNKEGVGKRRSSTLIVGL